MFKSIIGATAIIGAFAFGQYTAHDLTPAPTPITVQTATSTSSDSDWTPVHSCDNIDWRQTDTDGREFIPLDANEDGYIDCSSDIELGA